jgi:hypothetical protein
MSARVLKVIASFVFLSILFSGAYLTIYVTVHQSLRQSANDPQLQLAEDAALRLESGKQVELESTIVSRKSLAPFIILVDQNHKLVKSSATDISTLPLPPIGSFDLAKARGEIFFTWEPEQGLRFATVIRYLKVADKETYIIAARSLREVEIRENRVFVMVAIAWVATELIILVGSTIFYFLSASR